MGRRLTAWRGAVPALVLGLALGGTSAAGQQGTPGAEGPPLPEGCAVVADGLVNPRFGAVADDGTLYVSEAGVGGDEVLLPPDEGGEEAPQVSGTPQAEVATPAADEQAQAGPPPTHGTTGQVTMVAPDGTQSVVASGLTSYSEGIGPHGIVLADDQLWVAMGGPPPWRA